MSESSSCPAWFISAPASGQGKTTLTCALAYFYRTQGKVVRVFKTGPDFLDPLMLAYAAGHPAEQLDLWMMGKAECQKHLYEAASEADLILIEGVMGLFDGRPSGADLAKVFGVPIALVIDAGSMAQTVGALSLGLMNYDPELIFSGLVLNRIGSERHLDWVKDSLRPEARLLGHLPKSTEPLLPERHLGLKRPEEVTDLDDRLAALAEMISKTDLAKLPEPVFFERPEEDCSVLNEQPLKGYDIGIARDEAFSFIYQGNIRFLERLGATLHFFSPLKDTHLPKGLKALWLPGGYPELHAKQLSSNRSMHLSIKDFVDRGGAIHAECGGMLFLQEKLELLNGESFDMVGLLSGTATMRTKAGCQGMQSAVYPEGEIRGHAHHRSRSRDTEPAMGYGKRPFHPSPGEALHAKGKIHASYLHFYFPSNLAVTLKLLGHSASV